MKYLKTIKVTPTNKLAVFTLWSVWLLGMLFVSPSFVASIYSSPTVFDFVSIFFASCSIVSVVFLFTSSILSHAKIGLYAGYLSLNLSVMWLFYLYIGREYNSYQAQSSLVFALFHSLSILHAMFYSHRIISLALGNVMLRMGFTTYFPLLGLAAVLANILLEQWLAMTVLVSIALYYCYSVYRTYFKRVCTSSVLYWSIASMGVLALTNLSAFVIPREYLFGELAPVISLLYCLPFCLLLSIVFVVFEYHRLLILDNKRNIFKKFRNIIQVQHAQKRTIREYEEQDLNRDYQLAERNIELEIAMRELSEKNRELEKLSAIDPLTGLINRRYFDKRILAETRRSKRELTPLGVAILDIDHFKKINDNYGHLCGDHCLKVFADILRNEVKRPSDVVCRYGGEEFVLILPNTASEGLKVILENIRNAVEHTPIKFQTDTIDMTVSIGATSNVMQIGYEHERVVDWADKLLYEAKQSGRNKVLVAPYCE